MCIVKQHNGHNFLERCTLASVDFLQQSISTIDSVEADLSSHGAEICETMTKIKEMYKIVKMQFAELIQLNDDRVDMIKQVSVKCKTLHLKSDIEEQVKVAENVKDLVLNEWPALDECLPDIREKAKDIYSILEDLISVSKGNGVSIIKQKDDKITCNDSASDKRKTQEISQKSINFANMVGNPPKTVRIGAFTTKPAKEVVISHQDKPMSIISYYKTIHNYIVKQPNLPCVAEFVPKGSIGCVQNYHLLETLKVLPGQKVPMIKQVLF
uniref:PAZ domain-containing protein n=1 Tax=Ditylenchus dipsaci TaxID=166011 RepID=A0A915DQK7_9BILA